MVEIIKGPWGKNPKEHSESIIKGITQRYGVVIREINVLLSRKSESKDNLKDMSVLVDLRDDLNNVYQTYFLDKDRIAVNVSGTKYSKNTPRENLIELIKYAEYILKKHSS